MKSNVSGVFLGFRPNVWKDGSSHGFNVSLQNSDYPTEVLTFSTVNDFPESSLNAIPLYSEIVFDARLMSDRKTPWLNRVVLVSISETLKGGRHAS